MPLDESDIISAIFSIILIVVYIIIGITICSKYFKIKQRTFLFMGLAWILLSMLWWSSVINAIILLIDPDGMGLSGEQYFFFTGVLLPLCIFFFVTALSDLTLKRFQRYFQILVIVIGGIFEFFSFYFLFTNPRMIIIKEAPVALSYQPFLVIFIFLFLIIPLVLGIFFGIESIHSENRIVKIKGYLLLIALILFAIGSILDSTDTISILQFSDRIFLIISVVIFYIGFIMPDWLKKKILEKD